ncbi:MAG: hypothetical protein KDD40_07835 [Bdellovibrionales bacterium]|nr:hypothetical protein [Bdellovibrionales bacterium]
MSADVANMRSGPGKSFPLSWTVGKYMPLLKVGYKNGWYQVKDVDGTTHWIFNSLVTKRFKCVVVKVNKASLRSGPGTSFSYAAYKYADKYFPFKRVNTKDSWFQVMDASGNKFWLHDSTVWRARKISTIGF